MESKLLPEEIRKQINTEAASKTSFSEDRDCTPISKGQFYGYIAGATEWAQWKVKYDEQSEELRQAQLTAKSLRYSLDQRDQQLSELKGRADKMVVALEQCSNIASWMDDPYKNKIIELVSKTLQQPKEGKGREPVIPMAIYRQQGCELPKGKEMEPVKEIEYMPIISSELRELKGFPNVPIRVPMHLLNEQQADRNHGQTLLRLKERGGLGIKEALSLINLMPYGYYHSLPMKAALALLNELIKNSTK